MVSWYSCAYGYQLVNTAERGNASHHGEQQEGRRPQSIERLGLGGAGRREEKELVGIPTHLNLVHSTSTSSYKLVVLSLSLTHTLSITLSLSLQLCENVRMNSIIYYTRE